VSWVENGEVTLEPKMERLVPLLEELEEMLAKCGETQWSEWMAKSAQLLRQGNRDGITYLRRAYGGMGSLNDRLLHPAIG
jgi:uncharacterized protein DUF6966